MMMSIKIEAYPKDLAEFLCEMQDLLKNPEKSKLNNFLKNPPENSKVCGHAEVNPTPLSDRYTHVE